MRITVCFTICLGVGGCFTFLSFPQLLWARMAARRADLSFSSSRCSVFLVWPGPGVFIWEKKNKCSVMFSIHPFIHPLIPPTFLSPSLPLPFWIASIRLLCRDVSFSTLLQTTGLNFFTGPKTEAGGTAEVTSLPSVSVSKVWAFPLITRLVFVLAASAVF